MSECNSPEFRIPLSAARVVLSKSPGTPTQFQLLDLRENGQEVCTFTQKKLHIDQEAGELVLTPIPDQPLPQRMELTLSDLHYFYIIANAGIGTVDVRDVGRIDINVFNLDYGPIVLSLNDTNLVVDYSHEGAPYYQLQTISN